jgi:hypothetical protein
MEKFDAGAGSEDELVIGTGPGSIRLIRQNVDGVDVYAERDFHQKKVSAAQPVRDQPQRSSSKFRRLIGLFSPQK